MNITYFVIIFLGFSFQTIFIWNLKILNSLEKLKKLQSKYVYYKHFNDNSLVKKCFSIFSWHNRRRIYVISSAKKFRTKEYLAPNNIQNIDLFLYT